MEGRKRGLTSDMHAFCKNVCAPFYILFLYSYNLYNKEVILLLTLTKGIPERAVCSCVTR